MQSPVNEDGSDGPSVAVQSVHAGPVIRPDHLQRVVSAASHQPPVLERQATGNYQFVNYPLNLDENNNIAQYCTFAHGF